MAALRRRSVRLVRRARPVGQLRVGARLEREDAEKGVCRHEAGLDVEVAPERGLGAGLPDGHGARHEHLPVLHADHLELARDTVDDEQLRRCREATERTGAELEACRFKAALAEVIALARAGNVYFDATKPFQTRKTDMDACGRAINVCLQTARTLTTLIAPFLPAIGEKCAAMLQLGAEYRMWGLATDELSPGHQLGEAIILVRKLDTKELFPE